MTTFEIDNTKKTKYLEVLESLVEQTHALQAIHNPKTWRLSALTFALHLHDCYILFAELKKKWAVKLPFSEAWDVDLSEWKNDIWSLVNDVSSFTENEEYVHLQRLCEDDYHTFIKKAGECLGGNLPLKDLLDFLAEKNTELKTVIIDSGQHLATLFNETQAMLYNSPSSLYETFYDDLVRIYLKDNATPYQIDCNDGPVPYEQWKASKSQKRLPDLLLSKIKAANTSMLDNKSWQETWGDCFDIERHEIDKEGFARYIFQNRKSIIGNKQYPCKSCLEKCFATLCLCEYLWHEYDLLTNPGRTVEENTYSTTCNLSDERQQIFENLMALVDNGAWANGITADDIKEMLCTVLGVGKKTLTATQAELSEKLWSLFMAGRKGDGGRVKIIWQNIVGFLDDKRLFVQKGASALNKDFFGDDKGYSNIDKGRPSRGNMSNGFREILPLLEEFVPDISKNQGKKEHRKII
ncbi:MAG: hypothetical protein K6F72_02555 [Bacteroidales bacterium]|nr:hypothetical protein [Bacteroidales bacterium]